MKLWHDTGLVHLLAFSRCVWLMWQAVFGAFSLTKRYYGVLDVGQLVKMCERLTTL